jgi:hypothetical protein
LPITVCARLVRARIELERTAARGILAHAHQGPARDHIGEPGDVLLGVDAAHTERMQLENLAGEIFVEAALLPQAGG